MIIARTAKIQTISHEKKSAKLIGTFSQNSFRSNRTLTLLWIYMSYLCLIFHKTIKIMSNEQKHLKTTENWIKPMQYSIVSKGSQPNQISGEFDKNKYTS